MLTKKCPHCGTEFSGPPWHIKQKKYCSHKCYSEASSTKVTIACDQCGKPFKRQPSHVHKTNFCSRKCQGLANRNRVTLNCDQCGKGFERKKAHVRKTNFCSVECKNDFADNKVTVTCISCGKEIKRFPCQIHERVFCSTECRSHAAKPKQETITCTNCGQPFKKNFWHIRDRNYCSKECASEWRSKSMSGENSWMWKGGWESYYGPNWNPQSRKARKRDNYTCQHCGKEQADHYRALDVHHIQSFKSFGYVVGENHNYKKANRLSNLITLCPTCHGKADRK